MGFSEDSGYTPSTLVEIMTSIMGGINTQFGTTYTYEQFVGTNFYKYFYALAQRVQTNEIKTSEIFEKLQLYFVTTNERILRPVVTNLGLIEAMNAYVSTLFPDGVLVSLKPMVLADAGQINVAIDVDSADTNYADMKLELAEILKDSTVAGAVTQGAQTQTLTLSNGQSFAFKWHLPNRTNTLLRLTNTLSENNLTLVKSPEDVKADLLLNISNRYRLGLNFEPQKYYGLVDAPWCSQVKLEYSLDNGVNWLTTIYDAAFDAVLDTPLENVTLVEN